MLDLEELEYFVAFAECGTLAQVAEKYHISTPSMTRSMQNLEKCFGVKLFERQKNKMTLNETGQFALVYAKKLLEEADRTLMQVRAFDERNHTIVVKSCAPVPLWESLKKIATRHPNFWYRPMMPFLMNWSMRPPCSALPQTILSIGSQSMQTASSCQSQMRMPISVSFYI